MPLMTGPLRSRVRTYLEGYISFRERYPIYSGQTTLSMEVEVGIDGEDRRRIEFKCATRVTPISASCSDHHLTSLPSSVVCLQPIGASGARFVLYSSRLR